MNNSKPIIIDPIQQAALSDDSLDVVFEFIEKDSLYIETFSKYNKGEIKREEFVKIILELAEKYKNNEFQKTI